MLKRSTRVGFIGICLINFVAIVNASAPDTLWTRTYGGIGGDEGMSVQQTSDGGFIVAGATNSFGAGGWDVYLIRVNSSGDTVWTRTFGGPGDESGNSVQQTFDGGFIIACAGGDMLIKTNSNGNILWTTSGEYAYSVQQTSDTGFIVAGQSSGNVYLRKTNSSGGTIWAKTYGGTSNDGAYSVQQTYDGGFVVAGWTRSFGAGGADVYLIKTNFSGDTVWTKTYGGTDQDMGTSVQQTSDSGFIITGYTRSFGAGNWDVYLIRTNSLGNTLWTKTYYGGISQNMAYSVRQTSDGGFIIAENGVENLIKTNSSGDVLWTGTYGGMYFNANSVQQTSDNGFIVAGWEWFFGAGGDDAYLIRLGKEPAGIKEKILTAKKEEFKVSPNLFNYSTTVKYSLPIKTIVSLKIHDITGREVQTLVNEQKEAGNYDINFSAKGFSTGIYFIKLTTENFSQTEKIVIAR
ncbi:MAG: T9SS type A sorting domain-containing protein [bacterium]